MDNCSKEARSRIMSGIRSKNTKPELALRNNLKGSYLRFHPRIMGNPDFGLKSKKIAIFVDGCFWHKCPRCYKPPSSNEDYWINKIERNTNRDLEVNEMLTSSGYLVIRIWEHEINEDPKACYIRIRDKILNWENSSKKTI